MELPVGALAHSSRIVAITIAEYFARKACRRTAIVLMAITFLLQRRGGVSPESPRQAMVDAQLLLRADLR